jgi:hypothetical protein
MFGMNMKPHSLTVREGHKSERSGESSEENIWTLERICRKLHDEEINGLS